MPTKRARSEVLAEIEEKLLDFGFKMEPSLGALAGLGHALVHADSGEMVDEDPDEEVLQLAFQWSVLNDAVYDDPDREDAEKFLANIDLEA